MFKRRTKQNILQKTREALWPSMGWKRTWHYYRHRILRGKDSTYRIAAGLAMGAALSFSPFIGTQIIQATLLAAMIRASWIAAIVGTMWGNPWTFPFIFWCIYTVGVLVCGFFGAGDFLALPDFMDGQFFMDRPVVFLSYIFAHPLKLLLPLTVGGYICALLFWPLAYAILYYPVKLAQKAYRAERKK